MQLLLQRFRQFARRYRAFWNLHSAGLPFLSRRISIFKLKINGVCVNHCVFCPFHDDRHLLEVTDLIRFFDMMKQPAPKVIVVNGGEPTLHPRFVEICDYLRTRFKGRTELALGTNLIPMERPASRADRITEAVLKTFDRLEVGCDDEHRNIDLLEQFSPKLFAAGLHLDVNIMSAYCSEGTRQRILALKVRFPIGVFFSEIHHHYRNQPVRNDVRTPCRLRRHNFALNCNGDAFFCIHQELEDPVFNLFSTTPDAMNYYLDHYDPGIFGFCAYCPLYHPEK